MSCNLQLLSKIDFESRKKTKLPIVLTDLEAFQFLMIYVCEFQF